MKLNWERIARCRTHPTQVAILERMAEAKPETGLSPKQLSDEFGEGLSQVSYHVKCLAESGLLTLIRTEPRRGAVEHFYRLTTTRGETAHA